MSDNPITSTIKIGNHKFPGIWKYILPEEFMRLKLPNERFTVCNKCHRVNTHNYRGDCRCCTYFPQIPNFLVGLALKDPNSEASLADIRENTSVVLELRDDANATVDLINEIESVRSQVYALNERIQAMEGTGQILEAGESLDVKLIELEIDPQSPRRPTGPPRPPRPTVPRGPRRES